MLSGIHGQDPTFLTGLNRIEDRISKASQEITSGSRVSKPSDDPSAISSILHYQGQLDSLTQTQTNLNVANANAAAADSALQTATSLLDNIASLGSQGMTPSAFGSTRTILGNQIEQLQQQLVSIANTSVGGTYIFGGDTPGTPPYTADTSSVNGIVRNSFSSATQVLTDANGSTRAASLTAAQIFDTRTASSGSAVLTDAALTATPALDSTANPGIAQTFTFTVQGQAAPLTVTVNGTPGGYTTQASLLTAVQNSLDAALGAGSPPLPAGTITASVDSSNHLQFKSSSTSFTMVDGGADDTAHDAPAGISAYGNPAGDNIFAAVAFLRVALANNDTDGIQTALTSLKAGQTHLLSAAAFYGNVENWISNALQTAQTQSANLSTTLTTVKDVDLPTAITTMTSSNTALQAAISAHASLPTKTLFDYLG